MKSQPLSIGDMIADLSQLPPYKLRPLVLGLLESLPEEEQCEVVCEFAGITQAMLMEAVAYVDGKTLIESGPITVELPDESPVYRPSWLHLTIGLAVWAGLLWAVLTWRAR